ncbi:MAG TPA: methyltransferase domain-containing protein [Fibrobacteraceae bacterium]|nr:methyltransferase domain-containing protein [Fibrobacteraceae bacterium]
MSENQQTGLRFGRQAAQYNQVSLIQKRLAGLLWRQLQPWLRLPLGRVLEIGAGTGHLSSLLAEAHPAELHLLDLSEVMLEQANQRLNQAFPDLSVSLHAADVEEWEEPSFRPVDLTASSAAIQWLRDRMGFLRKIEHCSRPGALVALGTFGPRTLLELHDAYRLSTGHDLQPGTRMVAYGVLAQELENTGFQVLDRGMILHQELHASPRDFLRSLKSMGVTGGNASPGMTREQWRRLDTYLRSCASTPQDQIRATWELVWVIARKK